MRISTVYPPNARKLFHARPGQIVQIACNDGTVDNAFYMVINTVANERRNEGKKWQSLVNIKTGIITESSVTARVVQFPKATMVPEGYGE